MERAIECFQRREYEDVKWFCLTCNKRIKGSSTDAGFSQMTHVPTTQAVKQPPSQQKGTKKAEKRKRNTYYSNLSAHAKKIGCKFFALFHQKDQIPDWREGSKTCMKLPPYNWQKIYTE